MSPSSIVPFSRPHGLIDAFIVPASNNREASAGSCFITEPGCPWRVRDVRRRLLTSSLTCGKLLHMVSSTRSALTSACRYSLPYFSTSGVSRSGVRYQPATASKVASSTIMPPAAHAVHFSTRSHTGLRPLLPAFETASVF